jgi:hypothetical protein
MRQNVAHQCQNRAGAAGLTFFRCLLLCWPRPNLTLKSACSDLALLEDGDSLSKTATKLVANRPQVLQFLREMHHRRFVNLSALVKH